MEYLQIKNWDKFQQCDRQAPWIKLYTSLLQNYDFLNQTDNFKAGLICLFLYAGAHGNKIPNDEKFFSSMFCMCEEIKFQRMIDAGFLEPFNQEQHDNYRKSLENRVNNRKKMDLIRKRKTRSDSDKQKSDSENENSVFLETETETETEIDNNTIGHSVPSFLEFYNLYPKKVGKAAAERSYKNRVKTKALHDEIMAALRRHIDHWEQSKTEKKFIPNPSTWLNQARYEDELYKTETRTSPEQEFLGNALS